MALNGELLCGKCLVDLVAGIFGGSSDLAFCAEPAALFMFFQHFFQVCPGFLKLAFCICLNLLYGNIVEMLQLFIYRHNITCL